MKFLHAADLHIDSPLRGVALDESARADRLRNATREAFVNLLQLAIDERVDFIIIAGDLFDGQWQDMRTGLWTIDQFRRLREHNIHVYLLRGNHDAISVVAPALSWPEDIVHEFSTKSPQSLTDARSGAVLHGQGYGTRHEQRDLAANYPAAIPGKFNIGVLHTSLTGDPNHETYAPTSPAVLAARGYDYWALGHIHQRTQNPTAPYQVFAGNTQGRHIKETGAKGCFLVCVEEGQITCEFRETDVLRWHNIDVVLSPSDDEAQLYEAVQSRFDVALNQSEGRPVIARVTVRGACRAHQQFTNAQSRPRLIAEIHNLANNCDGELWIEQLTCATQPALDLEELRQGGDIVGELLRSFVTVHGADEKLAELSKALQHLRDKTGDLLLEGGLNLDDPELQRQWLKQAESLLVTELLRTEA